MARKPKVGAPKGNQNRLKGAAPMTARMSFRCQEETKALADTLCAEMGITAEEIFSASLRAIQSGKIKLKRKEG